METETETFPDGYCTHFRDGSPSQGQISVPIPYIRIKGLESVSVPVEKPAWYKNPSPSPLVEMSH